MNWREKKILLVFEKALICDVTHVEHSLLEATGGAESGLPAPGLLGGAVPEGAEAVVLVPVQGNVLVLACNTATMVITF